MRIAQLAPTYERVPPAAYGGTELVVHLLTEELVRRGHDVTLFATGDSQTNARLVSVIPAPVRYGIAGPLDHPEHLVLANAQACFREAARGEFDLVHNHAGVEGMVLAASSSTPVLTTCHTPFVTAVSGVWEAYPWFHHAMSAASASTFPEPGRLPPIAHGIDVDAFPFAEGPGEYLLFLGRFSPRKGAGIAIEVARRAGVPLVMAGKVDAADREYYEREVLPHAGRPDVQIVGEVNGDAKIALLRGARALLFPIAWDEPFGLVMIEALACGTPIVAFGRGSVPEVVENGRTGFVVADVEAMVAGVARLGSLSRYDCRRAAETRFGVGRMVDDYERHYALVVEAPPGGRDSLRAVGPGRQSSVEPSRVRW